jgi:hypothetical protein
MLKRYGSLFFSLLLLASCVHHGSKKQTVPAAAPVTYSGPVQYRKVSAFNQIDAQGQMNITLHTGYKKPQVVLRGDPRDLAQVKTIVSGNTLYLTLSKGYPKYGPVSADIQGQYLNRFSFKGSGVISGGQLRTSVLDLYIANDGTTKLGGFIGLRRLVIAGDGLVDISGINSRDLQMQFLKGKPKVQLSGMINVSNIAINGDAWLSMYWIKSDNLIIRAKKGSRIQLAGSVNRLDVELAGYAHFKGRFLRAQRSFVKTHGHSVAEISSVNHQSTLATDASDIYFYNLPNTRADFMAYDGSVLDMREWNRIHMRDYDRYNHQYP